MEYNVDTAIILAAGYGTRMFPITKTITKEMLPVGNRPIIDYVVEDCVQAGITNIIFVVREDEAQIVDYYSPLRPELVKHFEQRGKLEKLDQLESIHQKANFTCIVQRDNGLYGTARPLIDVADSLGVNGPVAYLYGDALFWSRGKSEVGQMIEAAYNSDCSSAVMTKAVPMEDVSKYGVVEQNDEGHFVRIVEKPPVAEAPSNLINAGEYLLQPEFIDFARSIEKSDSGEYLLTDAFEPFAKSFNTYVYISEGEWLDAGTPESLARAQQIVTQ